VHAVKHSAEQGRPQVLSLHVGLVGASPSPGVNCGQVDGSGVGCGQGQGHDEA